MKTARVQDENKTLTILKSSNFSSISLTITMTMLKMGVILTHLVSKKLSITMTC